jgi:hypothetical protein
MTQTTTPVVRTSKGLVDTLFDSIDALNSRSIDAEHARAVSHTARTIVCVANLELEVRKFNRENNADKEALKSLVIEAEQTPVAA